MDQRHQDAIDPPAGVTHEDVLRAALAGLTEARRRRRTRRFYLAAALTSLVGLLVTATAMINGPGRVGFAAARLPDEPPIAETWPEAVHVLPSRLSGGGHWVPQVMVDDHRLIATNRARHPTELWVVDVKRHRARKIADLPYPSTWQPVQFAAGSGHVVWLTHSQQDRIWKLRLDIEDPPRLVARLPVNWSPPHNGWHGSWTQGQLVIDGDVVYVSRPHSDPGLVLADDPSLVLGGDPPAGPGLLRVPLRGGQPEPVPGTERQQIVMWPWLGELPSDDCTIGPSGGCLDLDGMCLCYLPPTSDSMLYRNLRNLKTGERRSAALPPAAYAVACTVSICVSQSEEGTRVSRRDGHRNRNLDGSVIDETGPITLDRFLMLYRTSADGKADSPENDLVLYDLRSGVSVPTGLMATPSGLGEPLISTPTDRLLWWEDGEGLVIVDLGAIR